MLLNETVENTADSAVENTADSAVYDFDTIVRKAVRSGARKSTTKIKSITVVEEDGYTRLGISVTKPIKAFITRDDETEMRQTSLVFTSVFAIEGVLRNMGLGWVTDLVELQPQLLKLLLQDATIDVLQQDYYAGENVVNIFSHQDRDWPSYDHNITVCNVVNIALSDFGNSIKDKLVMKMLEF